ncbi:MAG TPA: AbrB/MazE/SpoVT family DNA-binding domain-containing protein [Solirubrobacteraceae bacterium]|nr:AbrB/MazE/SpoVT family DNA-binding domain-containing protein [Solirubrobacteraceae bacterium]
MRVTIDRAGRIVVPKPLRDQLGLRPETELDIELVGSRLELSVPDEPARIVEGPHGAVIERTGVSVTDAEIRATLEAVRERR